MHLSRSTPALFAISSLFCLSSSLPFNFLEPLVRRATYSVVPVDGGSAASTAANGAGDVTVHDTIIITESPATKTIIHTDTAEITDYIISTQTVQLSGTVQTVLVTVTPPAATVTTTGYSIIDVIPSQVTITTTPILSSSSTITPTPSSSSSLTLSISSSSSSLETSSHTYDNGQWHTYYPAWNASTTAIPSQTAAATPDAATPTRAPDEILPPVGPGGGYGGLGIRRLGIRQDSAQPTVIPGSYGVLNALAKRMKREAANLL
jgi:hypothetical protein